MQFNEGRIPLYLQIYWQIREDIFLKELPPGEKVPTVIELHQRYGVSQGTVRKALELLEQDELILKKRGRGTFVREDVDLVMFNPTSTLGEVHKISQPKDLNILESGWVTPPHRVREQFENLTEAFLNAQLYYIKALITEHADRRKRNLVETYFAAWAFEGVKVDDLPFYWKKSSMLEIGPHRAAHITQAIRPWILNDTHSQLLGLPEGTPVLRRSWICRTADGRVLSCSDATLTINILHREIKIDWGKVDAYGSQG